MVFKQFPRVTLFVGVAAFGMTCSLAWPQVPDCAWDDALNKLKSIDQNCGIAAVEFDDGTGPALYVGGAFDTSIHDESLYGIAKWDGKQWAAVGGGVTTNTGVGTIHALIVHDDGLGGGPALYVGGTFTKAGDVAASNIAKWDGKSWTALGTGSITTVYDLMSSDILGGPPALIATGRFTNAATSRIGSWDGSNWSNVGIMNNGTAKTLELFDDGQGQSLYAGGFFASGGMITGVMKWTGAAWQAVGGPFFYVDLNVLVWDLKSFNDGTGNHLYAGGTFSNIGEAECWYIARWNGQQWLPMGLGFDGTMQSFAVFDEGAGNGPQLFVSGYTESVANIPDTWTHVHGLAKWDGISWAAVAGGVGGSKGRPNVSQITVVHDAASNSNKLLACGDFVIAGQATVDGLALWDGKEWSAFAPPLLYSNATVVSMSFYDDGLSDQPGLYAAGNFRYSGSQRLNFFGRWDGQDWHAVGSGPYSYSNIAVNALTVADLGDGPELFVGGQFDSFDGVETENMARWNGRQWNAIPGDFPESIPPNPSSASYINKLVFTEDPQLGGPALFATGRFPKISGETFNGIARWDGKTWLPLGSGLMNNTSAGTGHGLAVIDDVSGPSVCVCGFFSKAGGVTAKSIARWNGSVWFPAGNNEQFPHQFLDLSAFYDGSHSKLAAVGYFNVPWDTSGVGILEDGSWQVIGALQVTSQKLRSFVERKGSPGQASHLYLGGEFEAVDGVPAKNLGRWDGSQWAEVAGGTERSIGAIALARDHSLYVGSVPAGPTGTTFPASMKHLVCITATGDVAPLGGNGLIDVDDLLTIINAWGECDDALYCPADIAPPNGDGIVDVDDLLAVINGWS